MHYKNGREAKNGDKVVHIDPYTGNVKVGILHDAVAGNDFCNGAIAPIVGGTCNLKEVIHYDDFKAAIPPEVFERAK